MRSGGPFDARGDVDYALVVAWQEHIEVDDAVVAGKPVIRGTRLSVDFVLGLLAAGWSIDEVVDNYPGVAQEDVRACLAYASETLAAEKVYPLRP